MIGRHLGFQRVIFDCDSTLVTIEGIDELARLKGMATRIAALTERAMNGEIPLEQVYAERLALLQPTRAELAEIGRVYRRNLVADAREVVATLQSANVEVFIVSGGLLRAVIDVARELNIPEANVRAVPVEFDQLRGAWWQYWRYGGNPDEQYLAFAPTPLAESSGKIAIARALSAGARTMLVGDGVTDLAAKSAVRLFIGFGGVARRDAVIEGADVFIERLSALLPLALARENAPASRVFAIGLREIAQGRAIIKDRAFKQRVLSAHAKGMMEMFRILVAEDIGVEGIAILRAAPDAQVDVQTGLTRDALIARIGEYDAVIIRSGTQLDADVFAAAKRLKVAARAGVGLDNIDIAAATRAGAMAMNVPEANTIAAAEHALALMLALCRNIPQANASMRAGKWDRKSFIGAQVNEKILGIVGLGRVGAMVAARARAFGMSIIAFDPYVPAETAHALRVELVEQIDELLARADIITLHVQLTNETRNLIGAGQIAQMKPGARIINTARGGLIDAVALYAALASGKLAGAALDVFASEPPFDDAPTARLMQLPNVIATPHLGASTAEAQSDVATQIAHQVLDALRGTSYRNVVNLPFAEGVDYRAIAPYLSLAEKIGALQIQLARGRPNELQIQVAYHGDEIKQRVKPLTVALLKGMLTPILSEEQVNYVNAPRLAEERGILVQQAIFPATEDYANVIICRVSSPYEKRLIAGTLFARTQPRIVRLDDIPMDALPFGYALIVKSRDAPGVIGKLGTRLGSAGVNIAEYRLGRDVAGGTALSFITLDSPAPESVLTEVRAFPEVIEVKQVRF
ncbi:MAG: phosphoglycerate dehydrogenase [Chloroflexi bacterium]|nr:phosphoglycerate dehydrogenase [Chloroflexota bacterium]